MLEEAARLQRSHLDLEEKTLTIKDSENRDNAVLPMPDFPHALLRNRARNATSEYVFPELTESKHGADLRHWSEKVTQASGVPFTPHDLRRTFSTAQNRSTYPCTL